MTAVSTQPGLAPLSEAGEAALRAIMNRNPGAKPREVLPEVSPERIPRHVAIIMDGNGRWAKSRGQARMMGHRAGAKSVRAVMETAGDLGIEVVTLYSFSMDNWKRPEEEVRALMELYLEYMAVERQTLLENKVRFRQIGRRHGLPEIIQRGVEMLEAETADNTRGTLCLAVNYGSRAEIVDAAKDLALRVQRGEIDIEQIDESTFAQGLYAPDLPDPDLLIRTAGEMRISNYLLWQISYSELHVTQTLWPDFGREQFLEAIREYARRSRRFGGLSDTPTAR